MICPNCGEHNHDDHANCMNCGENLTGSFNAEKRSGDVKTGSGCMTMLAGLACLGIAFALLPTGIFWIPFAALGLWLVRKAGELF